MKTSSSFSALLAVVLAASSGNGQTQTDAALQIQKEVAALRAEVKALKEEVARLQGQPPAHLFLGMGDHHRKITTSSKMAQQYFDQGLVFAYAFNHDEAIRSFKRAARLDPDAAMPWWGVALCHGPHINQPMPAERNRGAWEALEQALQRKPKASASEKALIEALAQRYANPAPADRKPLDEAYAKAMRAVWKANKTDADIGTLYAEALMDVQPWDLWTKDGKTPKGNAMEIIAVLEEVLRLNPRHPGALHLYIHAVEASANPSRALGAADRLRHLVPACGHLVHMPSHIDVLTGRWSEAIEANLRAIEADRKYRELSPHHEFQHIYMAHNRQMLVFAAMIQGRGKMAVLAARQILPNVPGEYARRETVAIEPFFPILYAALVRFGKWDEILCEPAPPAYLTLTTAMWRFSRAVAYAAKGQLAEADQAHREFKAAKAKIPPDRLVTVNRAEQVLQIADHVIAGEIAYRKGKIAEAVKQLQQAIAIEDDLLYMEPPEWTIPVRHALGAILLRDKQPEAAEKVYREDLRRWPDNGWSLHGLAQTLEVLGKKTEAAKVQERFQEVWKHSDVKIQSSCFCVEK